VRCSGTLCTALLISALAIALVPPALAQDKRERVRDFEPLFSSDGAPTGWTVRQWDDVSKPAEAKWVVRDGVLHGGEPRGTWLMSEREYGDFELEFEFKLGPQGNSGLALRSPMKGDPAFDGLELQMADVRYNPEAKDSELTGGLFRVVLNGELIQDIDLDEQEQTAQRHDGSGAPPIKARPRRGQIGFQELSRGDGQVLIRNAQIRRLD